MCLVRSARTPSGVPAELNGTAAVALETFADHVTWRVPLPRATRSGLSVGQDNAAQVGVPARPRVIPRAPPGVR